MKTNQWIQDVQKIIGCEAPELLCVLAKIATEDNSRGLFARKCQSKILECMKDVKLFLGEIRRNAQDFTLHDIQHCINVIDFMGQMLVDIDKLNPAEISFFIYSALLHDIGMVKLPEEDTELDDIREDHGDRSAKFIRERIISTDNGKRLDFGDWDDVYVEYLPSICASHMQEFSFVEKLPQSYILDEMEVDISLCAILLRLADAMDLKRNRAPYQLYQFLFNKSISQDHWKKHMSISSCKVTENGVYRVDGICHDEFAHRCLYNHLDTIQSEIEKVFKWKNGQHPKLGLRSHLVHRNIETDGYTMWHHSFSMDILKITNLFMGEQLYGDKKLGLREIIQNSIDACMVRYEINKSLGTKQDYTYKPEILIIIDWDNDQIIIRDNGIGMNDYIIQNYFLNIGASYYSSRDFKKKNLKYSPSGYFGIGFLSAFMLSDDVYVRTAHWQEDVEYEFHFIKSDKFVTKIEKRKTFSGTEIRLNLKQFGDVFKVHSSKINLIGAETDIAESIIEFLYYTFWNLKIIQIDKNTVLCSLQTDSFSKITKERYEEIFDYNIELSDYIIDIEGFIHLRTNKLFDAMKCLTKFNEEDPLGALKRGEINIGNNVRDNLPFIKHFYTFIQNEFLEIKDDSKINFNSLVFFPAKESKIQMDEAKTIGKELSEIKKWSSLHSWNCICTDNYTDYNINNEIIVDYNYKHLDAQNSKIFKGYIGYCPAIFIELGVKNKSFSNIEYRSKFRLYREDLEEKIWLNLARIKLSNDIVMISNFTYFKIEKIAMRIFNPYIITDSSRKFIVDSSAVRLMQAISVCIYLWIYDQLKTEKDAIKSTEYLRQLILKEWDDSVEGLLRPEKKPI